MKRAFITGITGQDGSYLAEFLLNRGYEVHGIIRRSSSFNTQRIDHIYQDPHEPDARLFLYYGDLTDLGVMTDILYSVRPSEVYHLGAQSHVRVSYDLPEYTGTVTGLSTTRILEAIRRSSLKTRFYQASSSEMFGLAPPPQNEETGFQPQSPYAAAKVYAYWMTRNYRDAYRMFAVNGILFNHESPRRGETFVTRKITAGLAKILNGKAECLYLGNLDSRRDWGYAPEFVEAMWQMLQLGDPEDFVLGTGESHSVREFVMEAASYCGIEIEWRGEGETEEGVVRSCAQGVADKVKPGVVIVRIDERYYRPVEIPVLRADMTKARRVLSWEPKVRFKDLVSILLDHDLRSAGMIPPGDGFRALEAHPGIAPAEHKTLLQSIRDTAGK